MSIGQGLRLTIPFLLGHGIARVGAVLRWLEANHDIGFGYAHLLQFFGHVAVGAVDLYPDFTIGLDVEVEDDGVTKYQTIPTKTYKLVMIMFGIGNNLAINIL